MIYEYKMVDCIKCSTEVKRQKKWIYECWQKDGHDRESMEELFQ